MPNLRRAVALLLVPFVLVALAGPAQAQPLGALQPGVSISSVTGHVGRSTPMYDLDVTFTFAGTVSCPAELHWRYATTSGKSDVCGATDPSPASFVLRVPMFGQYDTLAPGAPFGIRAEVRDAGAGANPEPGSWHEVDAPPVPVFVAVGDDYALGESAGTTWAESAAGANAWKYGPFTSDRGSWTTTYTAPAAWQPDWVVVASPGDVAADLPGQVAGIHEALDAHAGSWNWVGVSAGLAESGIIDAVDAFRVLHPALDPWRVPEGHPELCPDYTAVPVRVAASALGVVTAVHAVIDDVLDRDAGANVLQILYPHVAEVGQDEVAPGGDDDPVPGYHNPCQEATATAVDVLDTAVAVDLPGFDDGVLTLDMRTGWELPTGMLRYDGVGGTYRDWSMLQLGPGFPAPNDLGALSLGYWTDDVIRTHKVAP